MTSIEWLVKELYARGPIGQDTPTWLKELYEQSKQMYKQEILDAHIAGQPLYSCQSEKAEQYYQETFVSKGSGDTLKDYQIVDTNEMVDQVPDVRKMVEDDVWEVGLQDELNKLPYTKHPDDGQYNDGQLAGFQSTHARRLRIRRLKVALTE